MPKQNKPDYLTRVEEAVSEGKLWKAKEILRGNVGARKFDPVLYEKYGLLLLETGDLIEAGKYLFLAGESKPRYVEAIDLYLSRYAKNGWQNLYATFPAGAKLTALSEYPGRVGQELRRLGYREGEGRKLKGAGVVSKPGLLMDKLISILAIAFVLFILLCLFVGALVVIKTIIGWVSR
jgi:hypothetical protein